MQVTTLKDFM